MKQEIIRLIIFQLRWMLMKSFADLASEHPEILDNFLYGNGFSQSFHSNFKYNSLFEYIKEGLDTKDEKLFEVLDTTNFEMVLNLILKAHDVNNVYGLSTSQLDHSYLNIKKHLISAVNSTHPSYEQIKTSIRRLTWSLHIFRRNIFTTNYDLLTYWALIEISKKRGVCDGFYPRHGILIFSPENYEPNVLNFHYLHGALHFYEENGQTIKTRAAGKTLLESVTKQIEKGNFPLYVSEGSTEKKEAQINSNRYLITCFAKLYDISNGLTIFGQDLNEQYDAHLLEILNATKNLNYIAYGIYPTENDTYKDIENRIEKLFRHSNKTLLFFDSRTFFESVKEIANKGLNKLIKKTDDFPDTDYINYFNF